MFSGIVEGLAGVRNLTKSGKFIRLRIGKLPGWKELGIGASIAVNGACLTVVQEWAEEFDAEISFETIHRTTFAKLSIGDKVNVEQSLTLTSKIHGHLVTGHIDCRARISRIKSRDRVREFFFQPEDSSMMVYLIEKGSIAVDGVSLTVNQCTASEFQVVIIPHTAGETKFSLYRVGHIVNLEFDTMAKYLRKWYLEGKEKPGYNPQPLLMD
ncbi:riboflavin synthase [Candidatus Riflebacteria bacterium]